MLHAAATARRLVPLDIGYLFWEVLVRVRPCILQQPGRLVFGIRSEATRTPHFDSSILAVIMKQSRAARDREGWSMDTFPRTPPITDPPIRLAVCVSGGGTTLQNLIELIRARRLRAEIVQVVASRPRIGAI